MAIFIISCHFSFPLACSRSDSQTAAKTRVCGLIFFSPLTLCQDDCDTKKFQIFVSRLWSAPSLSHSFFFCLYLNDPRCCGKCRMCCQKRQRMAQISRSRLGILQLRGLAPSCCSPEGFLCLLSRVVHHMGDNSIYCIYPLNDSLCL